MAKAKYLKSDGTYETIPYLKGDKGDDGKSAYEIAVENGYTGTEEEWIGCITNITRGAGQSTTGMTFTIDGEDVVAQEGAERFNRYLDTVNRATGKYSTAMGDSTTATGARSVAIGWRTTASGTNSFAAGYMSEANGENSIAMGWGTKANGNCSFAVGTGATASGENSVAIGQFATSQYDDQIVLGCNNKNKNGTIFELGNGFNEDHLTNASNASNAIEIDQDGNVRASGMFLSAGIGFAEVFAWYDNHMYNDDYSGRFVTLEGDKIRLANSDDTYILGVISTAPVITNDNEVIVGLMGKLIVHDDCSCQVGGYCKPIAHGIAGASSTGYRVMKRIDATHVQIMLK